MAIVAVLPKSQKRNELSAALKTSSTTASSGSRWFKSLPQIRSQTSSKSQTVNVLLILNSRKAVKKSLFPLCSVISTALIASLVFVDKLGQLHCALRIQRRDLLTPSQSKFNCMIFHKSPALFIFTCSKPTLFYPNTMNRTDSRETTITSIQKEKRYLFIVMSCRRNQTEEQPC